MALVTLKCEECGALFQIETTHGIWNALNDDHKVGVLERDCPSCDNKIMVDMKINRVGLIETNDIKADGANIVEMNSKDVSLDKVDELMHLKPRYSTFLKQIR